MKIGDIVRIKKTDETGEVTAKYIGSAVVALKSGGNITLKFGQLEFVSRAPKIDNLIKNTKEKLGIGKAPKLSVTPPELTPEQAKEQVKKETEIKKVITAQHSGRYSRGGVK